MPALMRTRFQERSATRLGIMAVVVLSLLILAGCAKSPSAEGDADAGRVGRFPAEGWRPEVTRKDIANGTVPLETARDSLEVGVEAATHDRPGRFYFFLDYRTRDALPYAEFIARWPEIREAVARRLAGARVQSTHANVEGDASPDTVWISLTTPVAGDPVTTTVAFRHEYDPSRWPGERQGLYRFFIAETPWLAAALFNSLK